eukprot:COSAG02_NODE_218_length_28570_cov_75.594816_7_plen_340_part_00
MTPRTEQVPSKSARCEAARPWLVTLALYILSSLPVLMRIINGGGEDVDFDGDDDTIDTLRCAIQNQTEEVAIEELLCAGGLDMSACDKDELHDITMIESEVCDGGAVAVEHRDEEDDEEDETDDAAGGDDGGAGFFGSDGILPRALLPVHVMMAGTMNAIGPLQFNRVIRQRWRGVHRRTGYVYMLSGIGAGLTAIVITVTNPERYNPFNIATNIVFSLWLMGSIVAALVFVRRRQIKRHQRWVIRSYGAALTVATHRLYGIFLLLLPQLEIPGLDGTLQDTILSIFTMLVAEGIARSYKMNSTNQVKEADEPTEGSITVNPTQPGRPSGKDLNLVSGR